MDFYKQKIKKIVFFAFFCGIFSVISAQNIPKKLHQKPVQDFAGLLSENEQQLLNQKLTHYADSTSTGISIVIQKEIEDDINFLAAQYLASWGLGQKGKDNGVLLLMAVKQRKIAISTGYGVEDKLTDAMSRRIIEQKIIPYFKNSDYFGGFDSGTSAIISVLEGKFKNDKKNEESPFDTVAIFIFIAFLIFILFLIFKGKNNDRNNRNNGGGLDLMDIFILLSSSGRSSYGGGFSGGSFGGGGFSGGFGGFGGGSGGGGGASGSW